MVANLINFNYIIVSCKLIVIIIILLLILIIIKYSL